MIFYNFSTFENMSIEFTIVKNFSWERITLSNEPIGKGSYGNVFRAESETGTVYAAKSIYFTDTTTFLMEITIMRSYCHAFLNYAQTVFRTEKNIVILQNLGLNFDQVLRSYMPAKSKVLPSIPEMDVLTWCHQLASATQFLHSKEIIHCDIKASNVLFFFDNGKYTAKLADFSMSIKTWKGRILKRNACTVTHRPPECLDGSGWNEKLDIWSLGCTFFELLFLNQPFPYPCKMGKEVAKKNYLAAILRWSEKIWKLPIPEKYLTLCKECTLVEDVFPETKIGSNLSKIIKFMMHPNPDKRPTSEKVVELIQKTRGIKYNITPAHFTASDPYPDIPDKDLELVEDYCNNICTNTSEIEKQTILATAISIFSRIYTYLPNTYRVRPKASIAIYLAYKLYYPGEKDKFPTEKLKHCNILKELEPIICEYLSYCLL